MVSVTTPSVLRGGGPYTRADLDALPDDGRRHELIDGVLVVTPAPSIRHQEVSLALVMQLQRACPEGMRLLYAPVDVVLGDGTVLQPDVLIAGRGDFTDRELPSAPLLAVEILSPSTRRFDLMTKRSRYEAAGTASYWVIDPDELTLIAWELVDGAYIEVAHVTGDEEWTASRPFPVTIVPAALRG